MKKGLMPLMMTIVLFGCVSDARKSGAVAAGENYADDPILTVLDYDAISAIKNPEFVSAGDAKLQPDSPVIGVSYNGESHAYSIYLLNGHEIVNDVVGGVKIATTW